MIYWKIKMRIQNLKNNHYSDSRIVSILNNANLIPEQQEAEMSKWAEGGIYCTVLHSVYGTKTGGHIIINDVTGEVTQISDKNDKHWIPDSRIKWK